MERLGRLFFWMVISGLWVRCGGVLGWDWDWNCDGVRTRYVWMSCELLYIRLRRGRRGGGGLEMRIHTYIGN